MVEVEEAVKRFAIALVMVLMAATAQAQLYFGPNNIFVAGSLTKSVTGQNITLTASGSGGGGGTTYSVTGGLALINSGTTITTIVSGNLTNSGGTLDLAPNVTITGLFNAATLGLSNSATMNLLTVTSTATLGGLAGAFNLAPANQEIMTTAHSVLGNAGVLTSLPASQLTMNQLGGSGMLGGALITGGGSINMTGGTLGTLFDTNLTASSLIYADANQQLATMIAGSNITLSGGTLNAGTAAFGTGAYATISSYVPYAGASGNLNLGTHNLITSGSLSSGTLQATSGKLNFYSGDGPGYASISISNTSNSQIGGSTITLATSSNTSGGGQGGNINLVPSGTGSTNIYQVGYGTTSISGSGTITLFGSPAWSTVITAPVEYSGVGTVVTGNGGWTFGTSTGGSAGTTLCSVNVNGLNTSRKVECQMTAGTCSWNLTNGNVQHVRLTSGVCYVQISGQPVDGARYTLVMQQPASAGAATVASGAWAVYPTISSVSGVSWSNNTAPTLSITNNQADIISGLWISDESGTTFHLYGIGSLGYPP